MRSFLRKVPVLGPPQKKVRCYMCVIVVLVEGCSGGFKGSQPEVRISLGSPGVAFLRTLFPFRTVPAGWSGTLLEREATKGRPTRFLLVSGYQREQGYPSSLRSQMGMGRSPFLLFAHLVTPRQKYCCHVQL